MFSGSVNKEQCRNPLATVSVRNPFDFLGIPIQYPGLHNNRTHEKDHCNGMYADAPAFLLKGREGSYSGGKGAGHFLRQRNIIVRHGRDQDRSEAADRGGESAYGAVGDSRMRSSMSYSFASSRPGCFHFR